MVTSYAASHANAASSQSTLDANRKRRVRLEARRRRERHLLGNASCRFKDFRRVATRNDTLARNLPSAVALATIVAF